MINSFQHKGLKQLFTTGNRKGVPPSLASRITMLLDRLNEATDIMDLNLSGFDLHELKGNRKGTWAIKVNKNRRITFRFLNGDAYDVDLEDYH
ncbi:MAG: type II toxin-antitoxin system RelE/ParE family toxin [Acidobacteriota bacterium]